MASDIVKTRIVWEPERDILRLLASGRGTFGFSPEPADAELAFTLWEVDEEEQETGRVAGIEIHGFLRFRSWADLPKLEILWELPGEKPLPLDELLRRQQRILRAQATAARAG